jgi:hypothetical protein
MRSAKKYISPVDMEIIYRAQRSVLTVLNEERPPVNSSEARELSDQIIRKLVAIAREGVIDFEMLRERALAEIARF